MLHVQEISVAHCYKICKLLFNFASEYAIRRVQGNQYDLELNGTLLLLVYADVNKLGGRVHSIKENANAFVVSS
jgi:hypothetical protein